VERGETINLDVSVIIPTKNGGELFRKVLIKVLGQKLQSKKYEVIIVDSGSSDGTIEFIVEMKKQHQNLHLFQIPSFEFGHGKTRNYGASKAQGDYLVFITQDALPYDEYWLENLVCVFDLDPEIAGVFGKHLPYDDCDLFEKQNIINHFENFGKEVVIYKLDDHERYQREEGYRHLLCFFSNNSSAMRKAVWEIHPFPEVDFAEDQIWAKIIIENGYKKAYTPYAIVYHSHRYTFKQQFQRYYDEYKGLYGVYNYIPVKSALLIPGYILKHWLSDLRYLKTCQHLSRRERLYWQYYSLIKNTVRYLGAYLGVKGHHHELFNRLFSREYRLRAK